jgi:aryl-alcohol dehydrogenase-like predicted oxidoreductase
VVRFVSSQPQYSLLWRKPEAEIIPLCQTEGISQIVWSPLAQGLLTGKYKPGEPVPANARAASASMGTFFRQGWLDPAALEAVQRLGPLAAKAGITLAQFALAWVLRFDNVASAIIGATSVEQVEENARAARAEVSPELFAEAERVLEGIAQA